MQARVRAYAPDNLEMIVALSLRAWAPVFTPLQDAMGGWRRMPDPRRAPIDQVALDEPRKILNG
jgi:hypothetical protein